MDCNEYPSKRGVDQHEAPPQAGDAPVQEEPKLSTIGDMIKDGFVFFTPALLLTHAHFDRDPLVEFNRTHTTNDPQEQPFFVDCERPFFQGLGRSLLGDKLVNWNHRLYGVHKDVWPQCRDFIAAIAVYDVKRYHYAKMGSHDLRIIDPTALRGHGGVAELPVIDITVFCVSAYRYFVWIAPAVDPPRTLPYVKLDPPQPEIIPEAEAVLGPPAAPERAFHYTDP